MMSDPCSYRCALLLVGLSVLCAGMDATDGTVPFAGEEVFVEVYKYNSSEFPLPQKDKNDGNASEFLGYLQSCGDAEDTKSPHVCAYTQKRPVYIGRYGDIPSRNSLSFILDAPAEDRTDDIFMGVTGPVPDPFTISWVPGGNKAVTDFDQAEWDLGEPIEYNTMYAVKHHRWKKLLGYAKDAIDGGCWQDARKYCLELFDGNPLTWFHSNIKIRIQPVATVCKASHVSGQWIYQYAIATATTQTWKEGTEKQHEESKTVKWSDSVTVSAGGGFQLEGGFPGGGSGGGGGSVTIKNELALSIAHTYSNEWSTSQTTSFAINFTGGDVGKVAWQFQFSETDTCNHVEHSLTHEFAITEGNWRPPCCLPGYSTDVPHYTTCHSKDAMIAGGEKYGCKVQGAGDIVV